MVRDERTGPTQSKRGSGSRDWTRVSKALLIAAAMTQWVLERLGTAKGFEDSTVAEQQPRVQAGVANNVAVDGGCAEPATIADRCVEQRLAIELGVLSDE